jgi:uncharacterized membrane protein
MDAQTTELLNALFRWIHVVAGVLWIGLLYFFNWVNGPFGKTLDAETKQKALPELLPRTLYFFRWGAAYTWISGVLLLGIVYYMGGPMVEGDADASQATAIAAASFIVGALIYDVLWKSPLGNNEAAAVVVSFVLLVGLMFAWATLTDISPRAQFIHVGALFGTAMAWNVWVRIWPAQRKIIAGIKSGTPADPSNGKVAGLRSKHNTYMSVPLIFIMISSHFPSVLGFNGDQGWVLLSAVIVVGWLFTWWVYKKSRTDAPAFY